MASGRKRDPKGPGSRSAILLLLVLPALALVSLAVSQPPTATTDPASSIGTSTATLNGTVDANGYSSTVTFEYGLDTSYGTTVTADQSPVGGDVETPVSKAITGLSSNTTYHYRVVATSTKGTTYGLDEVFITSSPNMPTVTTDAVTAIGQSTANSGGDVTSQGSAPVTARGVCWSTSANPTTTDALTSDGSGTGSFTSSLTGLTASTSYYVRAYATNSYGTAYGNNEPFTTLPPPPTATTDAATAVGATSATLNGTVNPNGDSTAVTFEYGVDTSYGTTATADQSPLTGASDTPVSKAITGLTTGVTYHYRVAAQNAGGTTYGADRTFTAGSGPPTATTGAASGVMATGATLNGTVNAKNSSTVVTFEYGPTMAYGAIVAANPSTVTGNTDTPVSQGVTGLTAKTTYHHRVVATNAGGTICGADMTFTTLPLAPAATTGAASGVAATGATLNGTVNANDDSTTVTFEYGPTPAYGTTVTADQSPVSGAADTPVSKALTGLTTGVTYHYRVMATNAGGTTVGADMTFTTGPGPPTATTNAASNVTATGATLNGTVNANNSSTAVTFEYGPTVAYGTTVTADQSPVTGSTATAVSKAVTGLPANMTYHYRVVATSAGGTTYCADMTFTTGSLPPTATTGAASSVTATGATLNGTVNAHNDSTTVTFHYGPTIAYGMTVTADHSPITGDLDTPVSKDITGLTTGTTYHYRIAAQNGTGTRYGADMTFTPRDSDPPGVTSVAPTSLADTDVGSVTVEITFDEPMDTGMNPSPTITGLATDPYTITGNAWSNGDRTWSGTFVFHDDGEEATGTYAISGFADVHGNAMDADSSNTVDVDTENPAFESFTINGGTVDAACEVTLAFQTRVEDTRGITAGSVSVVEGSVPTGNATLGTITIATQTQDGPKAVDVTGTIALSDLTGCPAQVSLMLEATDDAGNVTQEIATSGNVTDVTVPVIYDLVVAQHVVVNDSCETNVPFSATITDNCCVTPGGITVTATNPTGNLTIDFSQATDVTLTQNGSDRVDISGVVPVRCVTGCPAIVQVTVTADDCCGNMVSLASKADANDPNETGYVLDETKPIPRDDPRQDMVMDESAIIDPLVEVRRDEFGVHRLVLRENTPVRIDVVANDADNCSCGDPAHPFAACGVCPGCCGTMLVHEIVTSPAYGTATIEGAAGDCAGGSVIRFAPDRSYVGPDEFTYRTRDMCGNLSDVVSTVYLQTVAEVAMEDVFVTGCSGEPVEFTVTATDLWVDANPEAIPFGFSLVSGPSHGALIGDLADIGLTPPSRIVVVGTAVPTLDFTETAQVTLHYVSVDGFVGRDAILVRFADPFGNETTARVDLAVGACDGIGRPEIEVANGEVLRIIAPGGSILSASSVLLVGLADGLECPEALSVSFDDAIGGFVLSVDTGALSPDEYFLSIPLGDDRMAEVTLVVEEEAP